MRPEVKMPVTDEDPRSLAVAFRWDLQFRVRGIVHLMAGFIPHKDLNPRKALQEESAGALEGFRSHRVRDT